jgi:hypothetical protein
MSTSDAMRKAARAAIEKPLPIPQAAPAPEVIEALEAIKARLDRPTPAPEVTEALAAFGTRFDRQEAETRELRASLDTLMLRQEMTPPAAAACEAAAARMTRAAGEVSTAAGLLQEVGRHFRDAVAEILEHREGRGRRMATALLLAASLPGVVGNIWLAWRANLL